MKMRRQDDVDAIVLVFVGLFVMGLVMVGRDRLGRALCRTAHGYPSMQRLLRCYSV